MPERGACTKLKQCFLTHVPEVGIGRSEFGGGRRIHMFDLMAVGVYFCGTNSQQEVRS